MTINELLEKNPEDIAKLSDTQLAAILAPYFPAVRKSILPPEKARKSSVEASMIQALMDANKETIDAIRKARQ